MPPFHIAHFRLFIASAFLLQSGTFVFAIDQCAPDQQCCISLEGIAADSFIITGRGLAELNQDIPGYLIPLSEMENKKVLDLGCGEGTFVLDLRKKGIEAFGIDPQIKNSPHDFLITGSAASLPFPSQSFDFVFSSFSIFVNLYIDDFTESELLTFIQEIKRVLRPLGRARLHTGTSVSKKVLKLIEGFPDLIGNTIANGKVVEIVYWP